MTTDENEDSRPVPDPTSLTTDALNKARDFTISESNHLKELLSQRLFYIERIEEIRQQKDSTALTAALAAQEKAADKVESAINKQIADLTQLITTGNKTLSDKIEDVKERFGSTERGEARSGGVAAGIDLARTRTIAGIVLGCTVLAAVIGIITFVIANTTP